VPPDRTAQFLRVALQGSLADTDWLELREALAELVRLEVRSQVHVRPIHVGVADHREWSPAALLQLVEEFVADKLFAQWSSLQARAAGVGSIEAYLRQTIRHWLRDRQYERDPLGIASFHTLKAGVEQAVEKGKLTLTPTGADGRCHNLHRSFCGVVGVVEGRSPWNRADLRARLDLLPGGAKLRQRFTTKGRTPPGELQDLFDDLRQTGCPGFPFRELLSAVKDFAGIAETGDQLSGQDGETVLRSARADDSGAGQRSLEALGQHLDIREVLEGWRLRIVATENPGNLRSSLLALVAEIEQVALSPDPEPLNLAALGARMGLAKQRMSELRNRLRKMVGDDPFALLDPDRAGDR
jgi:hypothetical protein